MANQLFSDKDSSVETFATVMSNNDLVLINMADKEMIEEKIGEALGLEKAAQKAVEELDSRGLLKPEHMKKLSKMKEEASNQEQQMEELVQQLTESDELDSEKIESTAE